MKDHNLPLGRDTGYPDNYAPDLLRPIPRAESRHALGLSGEIPFMGVDIWNAWELTWLGPGGRPVVATAEIIVPADSPNIIESKSLKLYLNSFAMTPVESGIEDMIRKDLSGCAGDDVDVRVMPLIRNEFRRVSRLAGDCIDNLDVRCSDSEVDPELLHANALQETNEDLYSHLLRSLCPVTGQPDMPACRSATVVRRSTVPVCCDTSCRTAGTATSTKPASSECSSTSWSAVSPRHSPSTHATSGAAVSTSIPAAAPLPESR